MSEEIQKEESTKKSGIFKKIIVPVATCVAGTLLGIYLAKKSGKCDTKGAQNSNNGFNNRQH